MLEFNKDNFEEVVVKSDLPVVVDLWGPQCGPCLALMPDVVKLSESYEGKVKFGKINVAENRRLCMSLKVMGVPTILFYKDGVQVDKITGDDVSVDAIKERADKLL